MPNVRISNIARQVLLQTIRESNIPASKGLRLEEIEGRLSLRIDNPTHKDDVLELQGSVLVIIDKELDARIGPATIDIDENEIEPRLVIFRHKKQE